MVRSIEIALARVDSRLEMAARSLGAGPWRAFVTVTIPLASRGILAAILLAFARVAAAELSVGDPAPAFDLTGSDGKNYTLEGLLAAREGVVLAWFPKAFTPG